MARAVRAWPEILHPMRKSSNPGALFIVYERNDKRLGWPLGAVELGRRPRHAPGLRIEFDVWPATTGWRLKHRAESTWYRPDSGRKTCAPWYGAKFRDDEA
jgi:hypothetical protein